MSEGLQRFHWAQDGVIDAVRAELAAGRKRSHWMWFIFPQLAGLGHSATAQKFAIHSLEEARAYLADPVLGARLRECGELLLQHRGESPATILGDIDARKLRSCLTLFDAASTEPLFRELLDAFYGGEPDPATLAILQGEQA